MIFGIVAISIGVLGYLILSSVWFWICWDLLAAMLVAVGCFGEWYLFKASARPDHENEHRRRELQFISAVAIGVTMELFALPHGILEALRLEERIAVANERSEKLHQMNLELEQVVLDERRLTANERWRLERVEKAMLPRGVTDQQCAFLVTNLSGLGPINLVVLNRHEPMFFGNSLMLLLQQAGVFGRMVLTEERNGDFVMPFSSGLVMYSRAPTSSRLQSVFNRAGVSVGGTVGLPPPFGISTNENCIFVGENGAAFGGSDGQPGEGLDKNNRPVPMPR